VSAVTVPGGGRPQARAVLVRHTRPAVGAAVCHGRADVELAGSWPADIAACLAAVPAATRVLTSPSRRCRTLAREIGRRDRVPVLVDERLCELDFGRWEGRAWSAIPSVEVAAWAADLLDYAPGDGETLRALWARVQQWRQAALNAQAPGAVVVSHHGPIRALAAQAADEPPERMFTRRVDRRRCGVRMFRLGSAR
jgi:alpha-ribazole phosphatase